jgi:Beta propeller domain
MLPHRVIDRHVALAALLLLVSAAPLLANETKTVRERKPALTAFADDAQLAAFFATLQARRSERLQASGMATAQVPGAFPVPAAPPAPAAPMAAPAAAAFESVSAQPVAKASRSADASESITNVQTQGVDEGGIVKVAGQYLVVLRRGRLFTIDVGGDRLTPRSMIDAFAPDANPGGAWYDEMLISGNTIVVIGYSYTRGGTEIGLFSIDRDGRLTYHATHHLRSGDYYSSRNYASRLIGNRLIFYSPLSLSSGQRDWTLQMPAHRRWSAAQPEEFRRIAPAQRIYRSDIPMDGEETLHTVTTCELREANMRCKAVSVLGPRGRTFYVSGNAVYVWTTTSRGRGSPATGATSALVRLPLDESTPTAVRTMGSPIDQMSFLESDDRHINVLLRADRAGDGMWGSERGVSDTLRLLRLPLDSLTDGTEDAPLSAYRVVPSAASGAYQNRYVGAWLLYGAAWTARPDDKPMLYAVRWDRPQTALTLPLEHTVERIEAMGAHALAVGQASGGRRGLIFSSVRLGRLGAMVDAQFIEAGARQAESRTHGFFYRADGPSEGIAGLPILSGSASARILYLANRDLELSPLGTLDSRATGRDDQCRASCVDWYGNARPIFLRGRVFALLGYELVEGTLTPQGLIERRRVDAMMTLR